MLNPGSNMSYPCTQPRSHECTVDTRLHCFKICKWFNLCCKIICFKLVSISDNLVVANLSDLPRLNWSFLVGLFYVNNHIILICLYLRKIIAYNTFTYHTWRLPVCTAKFVNDVNERYMFVAVSDVAASILLSLLLIP